MIEITNEDVDLIEPIVFPDGSKFDDIHRTVIKNLENIDIKACPGSGKTTTLIAKLLILEKKLPLENNRGICVLTHTNVGVNEIKKRSSKQEENRLFLYPNHISTIQVFVNKYLAIPSYKYFYKNNVFSIDEYTYLENFMKFYYKIPKGYRKSIEYRFSLEDLFRELVFDYEDDGVIYLGSKKLGEVYSETTPTYQYLKKLKESLLEKGILSYRDAYVLAFKYIKEFPEIRDLISTRFKFLFIDEMQDTSPIQMKLLNYVFDEHRVTIQRIGDINQSIFESSSEELTWDPNRYFSMNRSQRFSPAIARCIDKVCIDPQGLEGNEAIKNIEPTIIVFDDSNISKVLPTFAELIIKYNLHQNDNNVFKAVGRVAKIHNEGKITIPSYYPTFIKKGNGNFRKNYSSLSEYIQAVVQMENLNVYEYRKLFMNCLLHAMRIENIQYKGNWYSEKLLIQTLSEINDKLVSNLNKHISKWIISVKNDQKIQDEIADFIMNKFIPLLGDKKISEKLKNFCTINNRYFENLNNTEETLQTNTFTYISSKNDEKIYIELDTVYNVKGETHDATLYLETFYKKYDLSNIMEYLKQKHTKPKGKEKKTALNIAYVGLSRPIHLLCLAMRQETLVGNEEELEKAGWKLLYIK